MGRGHEAARDARAVVAGLLAEVGGRVAGATPRAYGYRRVSSEEQARSGLGLGAQRKALDDAAAKLGMTLWRVRTDPAKSGELPVERRPGLLLILAHIRRGDVLIVAKRDRLARDDIEIKLLERGLAKVGVRIVSAAGEGTDGALDDPSSALQRDITDAFSAHELRMIRKRTKDALRVLRVRGNRAGNVPYGYDADGEGRLAENPGEQAALAIMRAMRAAGASYGEILARLVKDGFRPKGGPAKRDNGQEPTWHRASIRAILLTDQKHSLRSRP